MYLYQAITRTNTRKSPKTVICRTKHLTTVPFFVHYLGLSMEFVILTLIHSVTQPERVGG